MVSRALMRRTVLSFSRSMMRLGGGQQVLGPPRHPPGEVAAGVIVEVVLTVAALVLHDLFVGGGAHVQEEGHRHVALHLVAPPVDLAGGRLAGCGAPPGSPPPRSRSNSSPSRRPLILRKSSGRSSSNWRRVGGHQRWSASGASARRTGPPLRIGSTRPPGTSGACSRWRGSPTHRSRSSGARWAARPPRPRRRR